MKKKLLFIGIIMNSAGTEKSFLSFVNCIDFDKYDVDLLLAKDEGLFMQSIPKQVNVKFMPEYGDLFLLSNKNAFEIMYNTFVEKNPETAFEILPYFIKLVLNPKKRVRTAIQLFCRMMQKMSPVTEEYDAAIAYWGDRTMFYMIDKVLNAKKKIAWMHFDYSTPQRETRDDEIYLQYFQQCDGIVNVSTAVDNNLKAKFPQIADKCVVIENIQNAGFMRNLSLEQGAFPDAHFKGRRILTVGRITEQKGCDMIPPILARLKAQNYDVRWYIIGDGEETEKAKLIESAINHDVSEMLILLGTTINPYKFMRDCDIYAQPSRYEGKPISVEEAKIMRCPIVVANYSSANEQLADGKYGVIAEINPEDIYEKIKLLLDNADLCENLSKTLANENFGNESEIQKFYKLLGE